jgi:hypothetical protein
LWAGEIAPKIHGFRADIRNVAKRQGDQRMDFIEVSRRKMELDERYRRRAYRKIARRAGVTVMRKVRSICKVSILVPGDELVVEYRLEIRGND